MRKLLPFETLESASTILNQICKDNQLSSDYSIRDFLAWAIAGEIHLTVILPNDFQVAKKNDEKYDDTPFRPCFPRTTTHCFISMCTAFNLSIDQLTVLDTVLTISNNGVKTSYHSTVPPMTITINDLRIEGGQLMRYIKKLYTSKDIASPDQTINHHSEKDAAEAPLAGKQPILFLSAKLGDAAPIIEPQPIPSHGLPVSALIFTPGTDPDEKGISTMEIKTRVIINFAVKEGYDLLSIPNGGKTLLMKLCKKLEPELFGAGDDPFKGAWKHEIESMNPRLRMKNHSKFAGK